MIVELITIGDEILDGRRVDTNTAWLGRKLTLLGFPPQFRTSVTDRIQDIAHAFSVAMERAEVVISTGGLGPTADDVTFEALGKALNEPMIFHSDIYEKILKRFETRGLECPPNNRKQALLPQSAIPLENALGTAPGCHVVKKNKHLFCFPGVPKEMKALFETFVPAIFSKQIKAQKRIERIYHFVGIAESVLEERLDKLELSRMPNADVRIAYTAHFPTLEVTLSICFLNGADPQKIFQQLDEKIETHFESELVGIGEPLEVRLVELLKTKKLKIAIAESMTGGRVSAKIVDVPGSSEVLDLGVVAYSNGMKTSLLGVEKNTLNQFGAVSEEVALEMARGVRKQANADIGLSITGIAGPSGGTDQKPVGLTFIGYVGPNFECVSGGQTDSVLEEVQKHVFRWDRSWNRQIATAQALKLVLKNIR